MCNIVARCCTFPTCFALLTEACVCVTHTTGGAVWLPGEAQSGHSYWRGGRQENYQGAVQCVYDTNRLRINRFVHFQMHCYRKCFPVTYPCCTFLSVVTTKLHSPCMVEFPIKVNIGLNCKIEDLWFCRMHIVSANATVGVAASVITPSLWRKLNTTLNAIRIFNEY